MTRLGQRSQDLAPNDAALVYPSIHAGYAGSSMTLRQVLAILRSYWRISAMILLGFLVGTAGVVKLLPKAYTATSTLIFDYENHDPLAGEQMPMGMLQSFIATQMELINSPVVLSAVVDRLKLADDPNFAGNKSADVQVRRESATLKLAADVRVSEGRGGQLLYVTATSNSANRASEFANAIADTYLELYRARLSGPATERAKRYSEQLAELRSKVAAAQAKVTDFRQKNGLTEVVSGATDVEMQGLSELQQKLIEAQNDRRLAEAHQTPDLAASDAALASGNVSTLKQLLATHEAELASLRNTLGPQHPKIIQLQAQIAATKSQLDAELRILAENNAQRLKSSRDLEGKFSGALGAQREKLLQTRELKDEGAKLLVELESAQSVYKRALDGYDQIMFASNGRATNVTIIDRATPPLKPSKPSKIKLLGMGGAAGLLLGLLGPLLYELLINRRVRHKDDFEHGLGIIVLAELGPLPVARSTT